MKPRIFALLLLIASPIFFSSSSCKKLAPIFGAICKDGECIDYDLFTKNIEDDLDGKVVKYAYFIRGGLASFKGASGPKRTQSDPPAEVFKTTDKFNPASVTKTITATALLRAMEQNKVAISDKIGNYLPSSWNVPQNVQNITFEDVLAHKSGLRDGNGYNYQGVQGVMETDIKLSDKVYEYENVNYALARILLAYVDGYKETGSNEEQATADYFIKYVQEEIFKPQRISTNFTPETNGTLFYPNPPNNANGTNYGDWALRPGPAGIQLSVEELAEFLFFLYNGDYVSKEMLVNMENLGLGLRRYNQPKDGPAYGHGGFFPASRNGGAELSSGIVTFDSGVQAVLVYNGKEDEVGNPAPRFLINAYNFSWVPQQ